MAENRERRVLELIIPEGVGLFEHRYEGSRGRLRQPRLVPVDPASVPVYAIRKVQDSIDWVAANMKEYPNCEVNRGWDRNPIDPGAGMVHYTVRRIG